MNDRVRSLRARLAATVKNRPNDAESIEVLRRELAVAGVEEEILELVARTHPTVEQRYRLACAALGTGAR